MLRILDLYKINKEFPIKFEGKIYDDYYENTTAVYKVEKLKYEKIRYKITIELTTPLFQ